MTDETWYVVPARYALRGRGQSDGGSAEGEGEPDESVREEDINLLYVRPVASRRRRPVLRKAAAPSQDTGNDGRSAEADS